MNDLLLAVGIASEALTQGLKLLELLSRHQASESITAANVVVLTALQITPDKPSTTHDTATKKQLRDLIPQARGMSEAIIPVPVHCCATGTMLQQLCSHIVFGAVTIHWNSAAGMIQCIKLPRVDLWSPLPNDHGWEKYVYSTLPFKGKCEVPRVKVVNGEYDFSNVQNISKLYSVLQRRWNSMILSLKLGVLPLQNKNLTRSFKLFGSNVDISPKSGDVLDKSWQHRNANYDRRMCILTRSCLDTLSLDNGASGALLKTLHLFNIDEMDSKALCKAISCCPSLLDLEIVGLHIQLKSTLDCLSSHCQHLERLGCQSSKTGRAEALKSRTCTQLVKGCPNLSALALRGFKLSDQKANILLKGFCHLKFVDFSTAAAVTGTFLRTLADSVHETSLEVLILRDCMRLKEVSDLEHCLFGLVEVDNFLFALSAGECKCLRHLDISNKDGLAAADWFERHLSPSAEGIIRLRLERPELHLVAEFPAEKSSSDSESMLSSFDDSDDSGALRISLQSSDISSSEFSSDSSYSSNTSSDADENGSNDGNPGYQDPNDDMGYLDLLNNENQGDPQLVDRNDQSDEEPGEPQANVGRESDEGVYP
eukprot:Gb_01688 [translate_table: standard]